MTYPSLCHPAHNKSYELASYAYDLPEGLIAQHPFLERDQARLMVVDRARQTITHDIFAHAGQYLPASSGLVINNSKVVSARLLGTRAKSGGAVEVFLLKALKDGQSFEALLRPLKKIDEGDVLDFGQGITAVLADKNKRIVHFEKKDIVRHLRAIGHIPLPPYIKREDTLEDREDYQTVYAKEDGSVASPTAGLHFTTSLMEDLKREGHRFLELTLHINYGTFKPVECADIRQHPMHSEPYVVDEALCDALSLRGGRRPTKQSVFGSVPVTKTKQSKVVAIGTTSCRVLESVAITGKLEGETDIFIYPGFEFKVVDHLITNFHLPKSTLLMLVCAFGGYELVMRAYAEAIKERYRFYSYGDAMLIL